jgi:hypothetical protein
MALEISIARALVSLLSAFGVVRQQELPSATGGVWHTELMALMVRGESQILVWQALALLEQGTNLFFCARPLVRMLANRRSIV